MKPLICTYLSVLFIFGIGCARTEDNLGYSEVIKVEEFKTINTSMGFTKPFTDIEYINLSANDVDHQFKAITKAIIKGDSIFLLDGDFTRKLYLYDRETGKATSVVGKRGNGPNEYLIPADFDVDQKGFIYLVDGNLDQVFVYNSKLDFVKAFSPLYDVDAIKSLKNGNFLLGLSSWNKKDRSGDRVILVNSNFDYLKTLLEYDDSFDDAYWFSGYSFSVVGNEIQYNRPTDNTIYRFSLNGERLIGTTHFDFGRKDVPLKAKQSVEKHIEDYNSIYNLLVGPSWRTSDYIIGTFRDKGKVKPFLLDPIVKVAYLYPEKAKGDYSFTVGFQDNQWISYLTPGDDNLDLNNYPQSVRENLANENFTLCIRTLNSNQ